MISESNDTENELSEEISLSALRHLDSHKTAGPEDAEYAFVPCRKFLTHDEQFLLERNLKT